jgi:hypothetical protein
MGLHVPSGSRTPVKAPDTAPGGEIIQKGPGMLGVIYRHMGGKKGSKPDGVTGASAPTVPCAGRSKKAAKRTKAPGARYCRRLSRRRNRSSPVPCRRRPAGGGLFWAPRAAAVAAARLRRRLLAVPNASSPVPCPRRRPAAAAPPSAASASRPGPGLFPLTSRPHCPAHAPGGRGRLAGNILEFPAGAYRR